MTAAIIGIDPGVTTGLAWGKFNPALRDRTSLWQALAKGRNTGCIQVGPEDGTKDILSCALRVAEVVSRQLAEWNISGIAQPDVYIICEDFVLRGPGQRTARAGADMNSGLAPVFVAGVLSGRLDALGWTDRLHFVQAGVHKPYATDARLKRVGRATKGRIGWVRGKQHTRDAWRLVAWQFSVVV